MTIRNKVMGSLAAVLLLFVGLSFYNYGRSRNVNERLTLVNNLFLPLSRQLVQIQSNTQVLADDMRRYYFSTENNPENLGMSRMTRELYPYIILKKFSQLERLASSLNAPEILIKRIASAKEKFEQLSKTRERADFELKLTDVRGDLQSLLKKVDEESQKITMAVQMEGRDSLIIGIALSILVLVVGAASLLISYRVLNPLPLLISSIRKLRTGDFEQSLKVETNAKDEVSSLAREFNSMLAALRDRDNQIQSQQKELLQSEKLAAIGQLSAEVVHEIRNPLNSMSLNIDWLQNELQSDDPEIQKTLSSVSKEVQRLNQITDSYLLRAKVSVSDSQKTPVNELLKEILDFDRDNEEAVKVETELWPEEIFIRSERSRLKQAFINIIRNAKEAMPRGGTLKVQTVLSENTSKVIFADTGFGMNETVRKNSFTPFFTTKTNGTGLGLSLTREVVEEGNGSIFCDSELGKGTTFTLQFPV